MNALNLVPFVLIGLVFWLLLIRPQRRRQLQLAATQRGVKVGEEVLLGSGIVGRVAETGDEYLRLEVDDGVHLKVARQAVVRVLQPEPEDDTALDSSAEQAADPSAAAGADPGAGTGTGSSARPTAGPTVGPDQSPVEPTERTRDH